MRSVGEDDVSLDGLQVRLQSLNQLDESEIKNEHAVFGVVSDVGNVLGEQAGVERVADSSNAHDTIPAHKLCYWACVFGLRRFSQTQAHL